MLFKITLKICLVVSLSLSTHFLNAQTSDEVKEIVKRGISFHDQGQYDEAISEYKKALKIAPNSGLVNYELAYSYYGKKDYQTALDYINKALKDKEKAYRADYYVLKGNVLDILGQPKKAIKNYEKGIKEFSDHYLLHYNLGLTQYNQGEKDAAEKALINALTVNFTHTSSHYLLGKLNLEKGERIKGILPLYFFLLLEPTTSRSGDALVWIDRATNHGIKETGEKSMEININASTLESEFSAAELMLSMSAAARKSIEEEVELSTEEFFAFNTERIFSVLDETKKEKDSFWWDTYVAFYSELLEKEFVEPFCYYISQANGVAVLDWMNENEKKMEAFFTWINNED